MMKTRGYVRAMKAITAAKRGHHKHLEKLIREGADVNRQNPKGCTALMGAALRNKVKCVELLLNAGAKVNKSNKKKETALSIAAEKGFDECTELLIQAGANVNRRDSSTSTALISAAENGHAAVVKLLVQAGADVNRSNTIDGYTALLSSAVDCNVECMDLLIRGGADVNQTQKLDGYTALSLIAGHDEDVEINAVITCMTLLLDAGANVDAADNLGVTPLMWASQYKNVECIRLLIQAGANVNYCPSDGLTALMEAVHCYMYLMYTVSPTGSNVQTVTLPNGRNATNSYLCTKLLIEAGADVNRVSRFGNCALMSAAADNNYECVKLLLRSGALVNLENALQMKAIDHIDTSSDNYVENKMHILLHAAGEVSSLPTPTTIPNALPSNQATLDLTLENLSREAIRKHLLHLDPYSHLFYRIPELEIPFLLKDYMLYSQSILPSMGVRCLN